MSRYTRLVGRLLAVAVGATIACSAAQAADNTRYVSITGTDNNTCSLQAPCRTLQRGINLTPAGGELRILGSGGFGSRANITRSLTISEAATRSSSETRSPSIVPAQWWRCAT